MCVWGPLRAQSQQPILWGPLAIPRAREGLRVEGLEEIITEEAREGGREEAGGKA